MGYFCADTVPPLVDYYGGLLVELGLDPRQPERLLPGALPALPVVGPGRSRLVGAVGRRDGALGHRRQGRRPAGARAARRSGARPAAALCVGRHGGVAARTDRRPGTPLRIARLPRVEDRDRFEGRPGGYTTAPGDPAVRDLVRGQHGRADRRRAGEVRGAARGARARTSSSPRTSTRSRSASRGRAGRRSTSPARSSRSTCCSSRSRSATTTRPATRSCARRRGCRSRAASA